jgi:ABC-type amino acid transport substrate-binding protein
VRKSFAFFGLTFLLAWVSCSVWAQTDSDDIADTLERSKAKGKLLACADPYSFPSAAQNTDPPGYDIEIMREIAKRGGMRLEMVWADTGTRGGRLVPSAIRYSRNVATFFSACPTGATMTC